MERVVKKNVVKALRNKVFLTQKQLADVLELSVKTIQRCERGGAISSFVLKKLCDFFEVQVESIVEVSTSKIPPKKVQFEMILNGVDLYEVIKSSPFLDCECDDLLDNSSRGIAYKVIEVFDTATGVRENSEQEKKLCEDLVYAFLLKDIGTFVYSDVVNIDGEDFLCVSIRFTSRYNTAIGIDGKLSNYI